MKNGIKNIAIASVITASLSTLPAFAKSLSDSLPSVPVLTLAAAESVMAAAQSEATHNKPSSIVILDLSGSPLLVHRMDGAFPASFKIAQGKAETALAFRSSTKTIEDSVNNGRPAVLSSGYVTMQGGVPLIVNGKVIGAIGVSGGTKDQDEAAATAGADVLTK